MQAQLHYDTFRNVLVQVHGVKDVVLLPPSALPDVYINPSLHPGYRQSQVHSISAGGNVADYPRFPAHLARRVRLNPGEALHIPPFWLHHVISVTDTLSVNVWSEEPDLIAAEGIFGEVRFGEGVGCFF